MADNKIQPHKDNLNGFAHEIRYIIDNANLYCFLVTDCGWKPDYIWEILNSNVKNEIAERVINKWNQGYAG